MIESGFIKQLSPSAVAATPPNSVYHWLTDLVDERDQLKLDQNELKLRNDRQAETIAEFRRQNAELKKRLEDINRRSAPLPKTVQESDECNCPICVDMRGFRAEAASKRAEANERGDVFGDCPCPDCVAARSVARAKAYLAERRAANEARVKQYGARPSNRSYNPYGATDRRP